MIDVRMAARLDVKYGRRDAKFFVSTRWVRGVVAKTLMREKSGEKSIGVYLTDNREIRKINKIFLKHDYATDVIAFDYGTTGDLVVSCQVARRVAKEIGISFKEELARYLIHGTLHLLGYNDKTKKDYQEMHRLQEKILKLIQTH